jgi:inorganic pyrophosphatase
LNPTTKLFRAHPWHGITAGRDSPAIVNVYIEIVPTDTIKYEMDKESGILKVDRPQRFSNICPTLYGFIPQTFCGEQVAAVSANKSGRSNIVGDGDPLDICVFTEKVIPRGDILLRAVPIGGLQMIDKNEADDKIIAVMEGDMLYGAWRDIKDCPAPLLERLKHYFLTYKRPPEAPQNLVQITDVYDREQAFEIIRRSQQDYQKRFPE